PGPLSRSHPERRFPLQEDNPWSDVHSDLHLLVPEWREDQKPPRAWKNASSDTQRRGRAERRTSDDGLSGFWQCLAGQVKRRSHRSTLPTGKGEWRGYVHKVPFPGRCSDGKFFPLINVGEP